MTSLQRTIGIWIVLACTLAHADDSSARAAELFKQGRTLITAGKIAEACAAFASSLELDPQLGTKLNLADCWAKLGRHADAYRMFEDAEKDATRTDKPGRSSYAREQLSALRANVAMIRLHIIEPGLAGLAIEVGARALPREAWAQVQIVDAGSLVITAHAPGRETVRVERSLAAGDEITVDVPALPTKRERPLVTNVELQRSRTPLWIGVGTGAALIGGSAAIGLVAHSKYQHAVTAEDRDAVHRAAVLADIGTGVAIAGAVAIGAGIVWYVTASPRPVTIAPTATAGGTALVVAGQF